MHILTTSLRRNWRSYLLLAALLMAAVPTFGQDEAEQPRTDTDIRRFQVTQATSDIKVDGVLDEAAWQDALVIDLPYEWFPGDNVRPPVDTECLVTYNKSKLFVAFRAFDPEPSNIRSHLMDRDDLRSFLQDDHVGITLDTFNDERQAFQFRVNPLAVQVDATFDDFQGAEDFAWDAIWDSAAKITDKGYFVEIAIPLQQLRFPRTAGVQTWGLEAFRSYPRSDRHRITSRSTDRNKECTLCQENKISGFAGISPGHNLEIVPTLTGRSTQVRDQFPTGSLETVDEDGEFGLTARWGITPNMSLGATYNPDFSQVEADIAQLEINTRFALFFPEKRPFFLEGADFFETPLQVVFTRTLADPNYGLKLTGKEGKNAIGAYFAQDDTNNIILPANQRSNLITLNEEVENGVLRYRRDVGKRSTVGVLYTGREGDRYHNRLAGLDAFVGFNPSNVMKIQYVQSDTRYPVELGLGGDSLDGDAFHLSYLHQTRDWFFNATYQDIDEDFRADSGFIPRVDLKRAQATLQRSFWGTRETWYRRWQIGLAAERIEDQSGLLTDQASEVYATFNGPFQSQGELAVAKRKEFFAGQTFELDRINAMYQINPTGNFRFDLTIRDSDEIDFTNVQKGEQLLIRPSFQFRIGKHINWRLDYEQRALDVPGGELFKAELTQTRFVYQFNVRTFVRAIFQYQKVERDTSLFPFPVNSKVEDLLSQLLFSYKINPQTVLFAGYTENGLGTNNISLTETDRTVFVKVGYAFLY